MRPYFDSEEIEELKKVLDSGWVAQGPKGTEFEQMVCNKIGVKYAVAVTNCTAALHLSLLALGIRKGDEVLVADYTYPATGHSVLYTGARPVFVDVDKRTYNIDPAQIEAKITEKTTAIIPVHTFGQSVNMDAIMEIAEAYDLRVIEDTACAFGSKYGNRYAGTIGDIGCFSFHARKGITTGEGGMVVTDDESIARHVRKLTVFGIQTAWEREGDGFFIPEFNALGYNYKMSDITAAVGVAQLRKLDKIVGRKIELARYWDDKLADIDGIEAPGLSEKANHIYQSYVALVDEGIDRNSLIMKLTESGVQTQIGTYASHIQPIYQSKDKCPNSLDVFNRALALPLYYTMIESEIDFAAVKLKEVLKN
jgi:dTDP-4-amino-4,6-dideoxygalactose transaminase